MLLRFYAYYYRSGAKLASEKREHWSLRVKYAPDISHGSVATRFGFDDINDDDVTANLLLKAI